MPVWQNTAFWSACRISRFSVWILLKISRNTAMQTFALVTVLPFNSTGSGILPTFGGSPPFSGAKVPQPVLLNDLHRWTETAIFGTCGTVGHSAIHGTADIFLRGISTGRFRLQRYGLSDDTYSYWWSPFCRSIFTPSSSFQFHDAF